jgi:hypothetical protein
VNTDLPHRTDMIIYQSEDGKTHIDVRLENETVWLSQSALAELFQTTKQNISLHLKNIFNDGELKSDSVVKEYLTTASDGKKYKTKYYNLKAIIAVGYRVKSHRGTHFRIWATNLLNEYLVKGFVMDDKRLKEGKGIGADYFDELLERIRDIRASEKRFYRKITDIYSLAVDYDPDVDISREFFATVQNKLHFAIHGQTAAELIIGRVDADKPNMGLTTWEGVKVRKSDVSIAKNYLTEDELKSLNRIVTMYLDYAEDQANRQKVMYMSDWKEKLDAFLQFNEREVLDNPGKVSAEVAKRLAEEEYEKFRNKRFRAESEEDDGFDGMVKMLGDGK